MRIIKENMIIIAIILLTASIAILAAWQLFPVANSCKILYISQEEIMTLENERIASLQLKQKELFFGKIEEAIMLATE